MRVAGASLRYASLDHWRGFAALWVLVFHANRGNPDIAGGWLREVITHGWLGVHIFFVVSGYCIAARAAREYRERGTATRFLLDRLLRLYPTYGVALACAGSLNIAAAIAKGLPPFYPGVLPGGPREILAALLALEPWLNQPSFLLVAWSLSYEVGFYLLAAAGLAVALRRRQPWIAFAGAFALGVGGLIPAVGAAWPLLALWPHFALGIGVWLALERRRPWLGVAPVALAWGFSYLHAPESALPLRFAALCALLLLGLHRWDASLAAWPALRWLGRLGLISYSLYLVHVPVAGKFRNLLDRWPGAGAHEPSLLLAGCGLAIAAAWCFHRWVEAPFEARRRLWLQRLLPSS